MRQRIGNRRHVVNIQQHNGNVDAAGTPTFGVDADWQIITDGWYCELLTTSGNERVRGRQVTAETTHVFRGEFHGAGNPTPAMRVVHEGLVYSIISAYDPDGDGMEMRIEAKRER